MLYQVKRPVRAAWLTFLALSAYITIFLPFMINDIPPQAWPLCYAYCALLAFSAIGLLRLSRFAMLMTVLPSFVAIIPGIIGCVLGFRGLQSNIIGAGQRWLLTSMYLFYGAGVWAMCFVIKGWLLHLKDRRPARIS